MEEEHEERAEDPNDNSFLSCPDSLAPSDLEILNQRENLLAKESATESVITISSGKDNQASEENNNISCSTPSSSNTTINNSVVGIKKEGNMTINLRTPIGIRSRTGEFSGAV